MSEEEKELTDEEKQELEEEKAKSWLIGQRFARVNFIPKAHERAMQEERIKKLEEEMENREREEPERKSETPRKEKKKEAKD